MDNKSIFLLASERSGTNLLRTRLNQYQKTVFAPEPVHLLNSLYYYEPYYGDLSKDVNFKILVDDAIKLCNDHFSPWEVAIDSDEVVDKVKANRNVISVINYFFSQYAIFKGYKDYFCKENYFYNYIYPVDLQIPGAKYIYLYRDPRDYALSNINRKYFYSNLKSIAERWAKEQAACIRIITDSRFKDRFLMLSYEDLITNESYWLDKICEFANLEKRNNKDLVSNNMGRVLIEDWQNIYKPTLSNNYNKYFDKLSKNQLNMIEHICWKEMIYMGYHPWNSIRPTLNNFIFFVDGKYSILKNIFKKQRVKNTEEYRLRDKREAAKAEIKRRLENSIIS